MKSLRIVVLSLALLSLAAGCAGPARDGGGAARPELVGAWRSSVQFKSGAFAGIRDLEFMYVFNLGGTMTESSNHDAAPPVPPAYGSWRRVGAYEFEATYEFYPTRAPAGRDSLAGGWLPAGRGVFTERIVLSEGGRLFTSTIRYETFDAQGRPTPGGEAEGHGTRIGS